MAQEWDQQKVQLPLIAYFDHSGISKSNRFAFSVGLDRDLGGWRQSDAKAGATHRVAKSCVSLNTDDDSILREAQLCVVGVNRTSRVGALEKVALVGTAEELLF